MSVDMAAGVDVEHVYLGACMSDESILAETSLTPEDFQDPVYGAIFARMLHRHARGEGVSQVLMSDAMPDRVREIWTATDYVSELAKAGSHERAIRERSGRRKLRQAAVKVAQLADSSADFDVVVDQARAAVDAAMQGGAGGRVSSMLEDARDVLEQHRREVKLIPSPWKRLNQIIRGFGPGAVYILGARPGVGKSAVATQIAYELAGHGAVVVASLEMSKGEVYSRIVSQHAELYYGGMRKDQPEWVQRREEEWIATWNRDIRVLDEGSQSVSSIRSKVRSVSRERPVAGVVVDYIHLLTAEGENENIRLGNITRGLKQMAMDLKVPVIALSQLNRATRGRPALADLKGSGAIESDGDVVMFLYRSDADKADSDALHFYVAKNRQGPAFVEDQLRWQGEFVRAVDW